MKKKTFTSLILAFAAFLCLHAQNKLEVNNPNSWQTDLGSITEATLRVSPQGAYMAVELFMTFNAENTILQDLDSLEMVLDFGLPPDAIVYDSWLWIEDTIVKAIVLDRWSASAIYEEIVDRRRDPSILQKMSSSGHYQLRVYPIDGDGTRSVKIAFLMPVEWHNGQARIELPVELLQSSKNPIENLILQSIPSNDWQNPHLEGPGAVPLVPGVDQNLGLHLSAELDFNEISQGLSFVVDIPAGSDELFVGRNPTEKTYQLIAQPAQLLGIEGNSSRHLVLALGYDGVNTTNLTPQQLINNIKQTLLQELNPSDRFNLVFGPFAQLAANQWLPGTPEAIEEAFSDISPNSLGQYIDNIGLLANAISWIQNTGDAAEIILVSNSDNEAQVWPINYYINMVMEFFGNSIIPIHIVDFQNTDFAYQWITWEITTRGNDYFNENLCRLTGGKWEKSGSLASRIRRILHHINQFAGVLDIHTRLENGVCFQRYEVGNFGFNTPFAYPVMQVGRFEGNFPMVIELSAVYQDSFYYREITIEEPSSFLSDTLVREMWAGNAILAGESAGTSGANQSQLIMQSINERVLSLYTAFLCLEPGFVIDPCWACITDLGPILVEDVEIPQATIQASAMPNPFSDKVTIEVKGIPYSDKVGALVLNVMGQSIVTLASTTYSIDGNLVLEWDGRDAQGRTVPAGIYWIAVQTAQGSSTLKVVKI